MKIKSVFLIVCLSIIFIFHGCCDKNSDGKIIITATLKDSVPSIISVSDYSWIVTFGDTTISGTPETTDSGASYSIDENKLAPGSYDVTLAVTVGKEEYSLATTLHVTKTE